MAAVTGRSMAEILAEYGGAPFSSFKPALTEALLAHLAPITSEMKRLKSDPEAIDKILADGGERASAIARETRDMVYQRMGLSA